MTTDDDARSMAAELAALERPDMTAVALELEQSLEVVRRARRLFADHDEATGRILHANVDAGQVDELHERFDVDSGARRVHELMLELSRLADADRRWHA